MDKLALFFTNPSYFKTNNSFQILPPLKINKNKITSISMGTVQSVESYKVLDLYFE